MRDQILCYYFIKLQYYLCSTRNKWNPIHRTNQFLGNLNVLMACCKSQSFSEIEFVTLKNHSVTWSKQSHAIWKSLLEFTQTVRKPLVLLFWLPSLEGKLKMASSHRKIFFAATAAVSVVFDLSQDLSSADQRFQVPFVLISGKMRRD